MSPASTRARKTLHRGDPGAWAWVLHRISGAAIFFFLFVHVLDTVLLRVSPQAYNEVVEIYKTPLVGLLEAGLVAAVLYHALNGIRVIVIDFWSAGGAVSAADVVDRRDRLAGRDDSGADRAGCPDGGAIRMTSLDDPRSPRHRNFEKYAWLFMRLSGIVLVVLALGHLFVTLIIDDGVYRIDFNYVARQWYSPFWRVWDLLLLWLAQLHGGNGLRGNHRRLCAQRLDPRSGSRRLLAVSMTVTLVLGTYVVVTFDPNVSCPRSDFTIVSSSWPSLSVSRRFSE